MGAAAVTYEAPRMLPLELRFPVLLLYSIGCAKRAEVPEEGGGKEGGAFPPEFEHAALVREGGGQGGTGPFWPKKCCGAIFRLPRADWRLYSFHHDPQRWYQ